MWRRAAHGKLRREDERLLRLLCEGSRRALLDALDAPPSLRHDGPCVRPPPAPQPHPSLAFVRLWRWPDVAGPRELRPLPPPACATRDCCNPYHWSRLCKPESPPPPYRETAEAEARGVAERPPADESPTTGGSEAARGSSWCRLAYWELAARVGKAYQVEEPAVNVFGAAPRDRGLCLDTLARHATPERRPPDQVARTRAKIGLGVTLSRETDGVWVYNRSEQPVFVHSPTLDDAETRTLLVCRVPPGHCLCVFDSTKPTTNRKSGYGSAPTGPVDFDSVRISFAKGWGPKYSRQDVTACPCWLEVMLAPCR